MIRSSAPCADFVARHLPRPLKVLESLYDSWFERIRQGARPGESSGSIGWPIAALVASATLLGAILIINERDPFDITTIVANMEHLSYFTAGLFVDAFALLLCVAPAAGLYFGSRHLAIALASRAFPTISGDAELSAREMTAEEPMIELLHVTILLVAAVPLLAIVQPFMAPVEGVGVIVITIVLLTLVVFRNARKIQNQMPNAARLIAAALSGSRAGGSAERGAYEVPGIGRLTPVSVGPNSGGVGKRLSEIDLHTKTGAVVVAIGRDGNEVIIPTGEEILRPGDVLELAGSTDAVATAIRLLNGDQPGASEVTASA
jgi:K+/H+ antiporter YhaU regulatory subunit KhtT